MISFYTQAGAPPSGSVDDAFRDVLDQRSRQEMVRDAVVFAPAVDADARLARAIEALQSKKVDLEAA